MYAKLPPLLPETLETIAMWREIRWRGEKAEPSYDYRNLVQSARLRYELMSWDNFDIYLDLFRNDPNPFIDEHFKSRPRLEKYIANLLEYSRYSNKRGGCDWLMRLPDGQYVGVLHLYDLNRELWDGRLFPCMIGYAIAEPFRRQGFAYEATTHLLAIIPELFKRYEAQADPLINNVVSQALLTKLGFREERKLRDGKSTLWYKQLVNPIPKHTTDDILEGRI